jgi:hypothetical protein
MEIEGGGQDFLDPLYDNTQLTKLWHICRRFDRKVIEGQDVKLHTVHDVQYSKDPMTEDSRITFRDRSVVVRKIQSQQKGQPNTAKRLPRADKFEMFSMDSD